MAPKKTVRRPASDLIEDFDLYPRHDVDGNHVRNLALALEAGDTLPPLLIDQHNRVLDGFHRRRAHVRVNGEGTVVPCVLEEYATPLEAFEAAVAANAKHARKFDEQDRARIVLKMTEFGANIDQIAVALRTTVGRVETLQMRVIVSNGDVLPAKPVAWREGDAPRLTAEQLRVMQSSSGWRSSQTVGQLRNELRSGLLDLENERLCASLWRLHDDIEELVPQPEKEV